MGIKSKIEEMRSVRLPWYCKRLTQAGWAIALAAVVLGPHGRVVAQSPFGPPPHAHGPSIGPAAETFEDAQIIARIGDTIVLAGDIGGSVDALMEENRDQIPAQQWAAQRRILMQQALERLIETKLIMVDAMQKIPEEALPQIREQIDKAFEESFVKSTMKKAKLTSRAELDAKLHESGSSLVQQREKFFESSLAMQWVRQQAQAEAPVTHEQIMAYYQEHSSEFEHPARARWEHLSVRLERHSSREQALQKMVAMGNDVISGQASFSDVARAKSDGSTSEEGGQRDWTTRGALISKTLDQAIFTLPLGRLSTIIEDRGSLHIVRVLEREDTHRTPFRDAQVTIEKKLKDEHRQAAVEAYYKRLRNDIRIWTIFDDPATARQTLQGSGHATK